MGSFFCSSSTFTPNPKPLGRLDAARASTLMLDVNPKTGADPDPKTGAGSDAAGINGARSFVSSKALSSTFGSNPKPLDTCNDSERTPMFMLVVDPKTAADPDSNKGAGKGALGVNDSGSCIALTSLSSTFV
jgi:hypothetical protein